jgi:hypothetical protein
MTTRARQAAEKIANDWDAILGSYERSQLAKQIESAILAEWRDIATKTLVSVKGSLVWMNRKGGLGYDVHGEINKAIAKIDAALSGEGKG